MRLSQAILSAKESGLTPIIGEIKARSPKEGDLLRKREPVKLAQEMVAAGVIAISVVTEPKHFGGSIQMLHEICKAVDAPLLRKDFITNKTQVYETRKAGANAVLLICCMLEDSNLNELYSTCTKIGIESIVEVHSKADVKRANSLGSLLIGINNRDLRTFRTDIRTTARLMQMVPKDRIVVSESGISSKEDVEFLRKCGIHAILVGEALMRSDDIGLGIRRLTLS